MLVLVSLLSFAWLQQPLATVACTVVAGGVPVAGAEVVIAGQTYVTDANGEVKAQVPP